MNLLGGLGGDRFEKKHENVCHEGCFRRGYEIGPIFLLSLVPLSPSLFVATWLVRRLQQQQLPAVSRVSPKAEERLFFYVSVYVRSLVQALGRRHICRV